MLREEDKKEIGKRLEGLKEPVKMIFFTQKVAADCQFCTQTEQLLKEVAELSDKLKLEIKNLITDKDDVKSYGIDKIPATVITGKEDYGIRFYGIPSGYEFVTLLETLLLVSRGESGLNDDSKKKLSEVTKPVHIQVFVTPTCPYCPGAALTAIQCAIENTGLRADIVEVSEFSYLGQRYGVMGVPKVILNEKPGFEGALPESQFIEKILTSR